MSKYDLLVFIGRFQPLHLGHELIIDEAIKQSKHLLVLVGSANRSISIQNPFTFQERAKMIYGPRKWDKENNRLLVLPLNDYVYNDAAWVSNVQRIVEGQAKCYGDVKKIGLVGFSKDNSSYYLKMFPQWESLNISSQHSTFNSTDIRNVYFNHLPQIPVQALSAYVNDWLQEYIYTDQFKYLVWEADDITRYKQSWQHSPFKPTFNTVDAVVVQSGHILLVERGDSPGKGLLALPGGFVDPDEYLEESAIRELREETKIADEKGELPPAMLKSFIKHHETFDDPRRSARGRTITEAFLFDLPKREKLFDVRGSDDAAYARWYPIGTVPANKFFEDHYFIMCKMLGLTID